MSSLAKQPPGLIELTQLFFEQAAGLAAGGMVVGRFHSFHMFIVSDNFESPAGIEVRRGTPALKVLDLFGLTNL